MNFSSLRRARSVVAAALIMSMGVVSAAETTSTDAPIITLKTAAYNPENPTQKMTIGFMASRTTVIEVDFGSGRKPLTVSASANIADKSLIQGTVPQDGVVKVYGDASLINYIDFEGIYMTELSMPTLTNIEMINVAHNELSSFDFSPFTKLVALEIEDNPFDKGLTIGTGAKELTILNVSQIGNMDPKFDLSDFPELQVFQAWSTKGLTKLTPAVCPKLLQLSIDGTDVASLDVSGNSELRVLNIGGTRISTIDVSKLTKLQEFYCDHEGSYNSQYKIASLDVTHNPALKVLNCNGNALTTLDVSKNPLLMDLKAAKNRLTHIDISENTELVNLTLRGNDFTFATLPVCAGVNEFSWSPMNPMAVDYSYAEGAEIDFSDKVLRAGGETYAMVMAQNPANPNEPVELEEGVDFTYADGKVTLLKAYGDSCRVEFFNTLFPDGVHATTYFKIKKAADFGKPGKAFSFTLVNNAAQLDGHVSFAVETARVEAQQLTVDYGAGTAEALTPDENGVYVLRGQAKGSKVTVYMPDGHFMTSLSASDLSMNSIDVTTAVDLRSLTIDKCGIEVLNLGWNNLLEQLTVTGNRLSKLDLSGANKAFVKNVLNHVDVSNNKLTELVIENAEPLISLNVAGNRLTTFDPGDTERLETLNAANNKLTEIVTSNCKGLRSLNVAGNNLTELQFYDGVQAVLEELHIEGNAFTMATLPLASEGAVFTYAPQQPVVLSKKSFMANLSAQVRDIDGQTTSFEWRKADGTVLEEGADKDYTISVGVTTFVRTDLGHVTCHMTHPALPDFAGANVLTTTSLQVMGRPTRVLTSFSTTRRGQPVDLSLATTTPDTYVYFDWNEDGDMSEYHLTDTYTTYSAITYGKRNVKVYTYEPEVELSVFSVKGAEISQIDLSALTSATTINISDAGLKSVSLPTGDALRELILENNNLTQLDLSVAPNLYALYLTGNAFTTFDLSVLPNMEWVGLAKNNLTSVNLSKSTALYMLDLNENQLTSIDLKACSNLGALYLTDNQLTEIDVTPCSNLLALALNRNRFTFATLPVPQEQWGPRYTYGGQENLQAICKDGKVDLSSQAAVGDVATVYYWYLGIPEISDSGELIGSLLIDGEDYTLNGGISTFHIMPEEQLLCIMTNEVFPALGLVNEPITVDKAHSAGVDSVVDYEDEAEVYTPSGVKLGRVPTSQLPAGVYIIRRGTATKKIAVN